MTRRLLGLCVLTALFFPLVSCTSTEKSVKVTNHWVHDAQLQALMVHIETETYAHEPGQVVTAPPDASPSDEYLMKIPTSRVEALSQACELADALALSADRIHDTSVIGKLSEADRRAFIAQADTLKVQATRLNDRAAARDIAGMRAEISQIQQTCNACHARFRDVAGSLARR